MRALGRHDVARWRWRLGQPSDSKEQLLAVLNKRIRSLAGVAATFVYLELRKQSYSWGVR